VLTCNGLVIYFKIIFLKLRKTSLELHFILSTKINCKMELSPKFEKQNSKTLKGKTEKNIFTILRKRKIGFFKEDKKGIIIRERRRDISIP
jgi:hypothetical protein